MITTGIIRRIDDLGRIMIPKEVRRQVFGSGDSEGKPLEFFVDKDGNIILKPYKPSNEWEPVAGKNKKVTAFICGCGCKSKVASNYCPDCGTAMDNTDLESRIAQAIRK